MQLQVFYVKIFFGIRYCRDMFQGQIKIWKRVIYFEKLAVNDVSDQRT